MYNPYQPQAYLQPIFPQQIVPQQTPTQQQQNTTPQVQAQTQTVSNIFVPVASEEVARNYPVAYGNTVIFKDENEPNLYIKKMGFSQLDRPVFEKFRLVKEQDTAFNVPEQSPSAENTAPDKTIAYVTKESLEALKSDIEAYKLNMDNLESDIEDLREKIADFVFKKSDKSEAKKK